MKHKSLSCLVTTITLLLLSQVALSQTPDPSVQRLPNPILTFVGTSFVEAGGKKTTRYNFSVENRSVYPDDFFAASPTLPPCGDNKNGSRTWVDVFSQNGKRLQGFCAFAKPDDLKSIWFSLGEDEVPPSWIYIEMNDRKANVKYKSNLAETTM
jgi:hypothetical protein